MSTSEFTLCGKKRYSKRDARTALNARTKGRNRIRHGRPAALRIYECRKCGGWHLTHTEKLHA